MFTKSTDHNPNYLASIVEIKEFRTHPNADKLKMVSLFGNNVITGIDAEPGMYCYFPLECAISNEFLKYTNAYREAELNANPKVKGFFEYHGRVRALRLRGAKSEGYIVPVSALELFCEVVLGKPVMIEDSSTNYAGTDFDTICGHQICKKYIPKGVAAANAASKKTRGNVKRYASKLVENQFHFHPSTAHLKKEISKINYNDTIVITEKYHGTSFVVSNVLTKKKVSFRDKIAKFFGVNINETEYGMLYSSRSVIKNSVMDDGKENNHYYDSDVWKIAADKLFPCLKQGYSFYGEIVGYTPTGSMIQKNYDYGCPLGTLECIVYRMTFTNSSGDVFELSHAQMVDYCSKYNIKTPFVHYYGKVKDLYNIQNDKHFHDTLLQMLINDYLEKDCRYCVKVPHTPAEGIIVRNDKPNEWEVYKLKSFRFLEKESADLDKGEIDMETSESV